MSLADDASEAVDFYQRHCAVIGGVVLVIHIVDGEEEIVGIFSSLEKAQDWADANLDEGSVVFSPYIIDQPEYGTVPAKELN